MSVPAAFDYHAAKSVDEAIALLQQYGDDAKESVYNERSIHVHKRYSIV